MRRVRQPRMFTDIGFVGLPILCCLLAGVIFLSADVMRRAREGQDEGANSPKLDQHVGRLAAQVAVVETNLHDSCKRLDAVELAAKEKQEVEAALAQYQQAIQRLQKQIEEWIRVKLELEKRVDQDKLRQAEIQRLLEEIERLNKQIADTQKRIEALKSKVGDDSRPWMGGYTERYVLVECTAKGATVYPPGSDAKRRQVGAEPTAAESKWLLNQVEQAGFVVLLARPGSFGETFDNLRKLVRDHIKSFNSKGGAKKIGRFDLPAEENEPIEKYLWKGD